MIPNPKSRPAVLITGTSTGIGAACALDLDKRGFRVFAGVRREADGQRLVQQAAEQGAEVRDQGAGTRDQGSGSQLTPVLIDVTDPASIQSAAETVGAAVEEAGLAGLVNNAGILVPGPLESVPLDLFRRQLEVNVVGQLAVTQALLPLLRTAKGRIVNVGSISGRIAPPYLGPYAASKFALEALTDALRLELRNWGIHVSIVEPDNVATPIWGKLEATADELDQGLPPQTRELYEHDLLRIRRASYRMSKTAMPVERVVRAVRHALCAKRPRTRYPVGFRTRLGIWAFKRMPDRLRDWFVLRELGMS